jgi:nitric oxide reductase NorQ protein
VNHNNDKVTPELSIQEKNFGKKSTVQSNLELELSDSFVVSSAVQNVALRAQCYLDAGYSVHFSGLAGTGKTSLALYLASARGRPVTLIQGDESLSGRDLMGREVGWKRSAKVDNYVRSVLKTEEEMKQLWCDAQVLTACSEGHTLVYDEFNRSRPEANNLFLSILSEGLAFGGKGVSQHSSFSQVHPEFRLILTSNPEEYAGVHRTQDALLDRVINLTVDSYDRETELSIVVARSGILLEDAEIIVDLVRELRELVGTRNCWPSLRSAIALAKILVAQQARPYLDDPVFSWIIHDIFNPEMFKLVREGDKMLASRIRAVLHTRTTGLSLVS